MSMAKRICHLNGWGVVLTPSEEYEGEHRGELHALSRRLHRDIIADVEVTDSRLPGSPLQGTRDGGMALRPKRPGEHSLGCTRGLAITRWRARRYGGSIGRAFTSRESA